MAKETQNSNKDEEVLAQLYEAGATEMPSADLDNKILNYAASANKSSHVGSHFGGGWKVPLSMAACLVLVFGILVQLEQSNQLLELPPMPELSIPSDAKVDQDVNVEGELEEDSSILNNEVLRDTPVESPGVESDANILQSKQKTLKKAKPEISHERQKLEGLAKPSTSEKIAPLEKKSPVELNRKTTSNDFADKPESKLYQTPEAERLELESNAPTQRSSNEDLMQGQSTAAEATDVQSKNNQEYAPIPVEDWLLMIEKLIARKDYAEAARQLQKFKQAHPKVNVEDLDAKIP